MPDLYVTDGRKATVTVPAGSVAPATPTNAGPSLGTAGATVTADDSNRFTPFTAEVTTNGIVEWRNSGTFGHNITFDDPAIAPFNDLRLDVGNTWQVRFTTAGTYKYSCTIHPGMIGAVVVR